MNDYQVNEEGILAFQQLVEADYVVTPLNFQEGEDLNSEYDNIIRTKTSHGKN